VGGTPPPTIAISTLTRIAPELAARLFYFAGAVAAAGLAEAGCFGKLRPGDGLGQALTEEFVFLGHGFL